MTVLIYLNTNRYIVAEHDTVNISTRLCCFAWVERNPKFSLVNINLILDIRKESLFVFLSRHPPGIIWVAAKTILVTTVKIRSHGAGGVSVSTTDGRCDDDSFLWLLGAFVTPGGGRIVCEPVYRLSLVTQTFFDADENRVGRSIVTRLTPRFCGIAWDAEHRSLATGTHFVFDVLGVVWFLRARAAPSRQVVVFVTETRDFTTGTFAVDDVYGIRRSVRTYLTPSCSFARHPHTWPTFAALTPLAC